MFIDQIPELLIAGNQGIIRSDHIGGNPTYISRFGSNGNYILLLNI